jgi:hypothetical protein
VEVIQGLSSSDSKGVTAEIVVMVVSFSVLLVIIIVGYLATHQDITADINYNARTDINYFNSMAGMNQLTGFEQNQEKMIDYTVGRQDKQELKSKLETSLSYLREGPASVKRKYRVEFNVSEGENISLSRGSSDGLMYSSHAYIASPHKEPAKLEVAVSEK